MDDDVQRGLEFLKEHRNVAFAVRAIEEALDPPLPPNTLASAFNQLVKAGKGGLERADATYLGTKRIYRGFKYVGD